MPGRVTVTNAVGAPTQPAGADFALCVVGCSTAFPLPAGQVTPPYSQMGAAVTDLGQGDAVDALCQAIAVTRGNPAPPGVSFYRTPATSAGTYGTINVSGVLGTALVSNGTVAPTGTTQPWMQIVAGGTVGTTGMTAYASLDGGRTRVLVQLGTALSYAFPVNDGFAAQAAFSFGLAVAGTTDATASALYGNSGTLDGETLILTVNGGSPLTLTLSGTGNTLTQSAFLAAIHAEWPVITATIVSTHLVLTVAQGSALVVGAGTANAHLGLTAATTSATFLAGDTFYTSTLPPSWADSDLYAAGPPATGAFAALGASSYSFALIVLTEPVQISDFPTLTAGLDSMLPYNKRPTLLVRFRDQMQSGETTAQYITAVRAFCAACQDERIVLSYGGGWLTDAFSRRVYQRSGLPTVLARLQGNAAFPGVEGEVLAQSPAWAGRGPLEAFSLVDGNGQLVPGAVDEFVTGGQDQVGSVGGAMGYCYQRDQATQGTYVSAAPCLYPSGATVLTLMDSRVTQALSRVLYSIAWAEIQGASVVQNGVLDPDLCDAMSAKMRAGIGKGSIYLNEYANSADPNLVVVNPAVTVVGSNVTITVSVNDALFDYVNGISITLQNIR